MARWRNYFSQLLNVHGVDDVRKAGIHTAEPLVPKLSAFEFDLDIEKLKSHKSPGIDQIYIYIKFIAMPSTQMGWLNVHAKFHFLLYSCVLCSNCDAAVPEMRRLALFYVNVVMNMHDKFFIFLCTEDN
jgi:hypothetical protein